MLAPGDQTTGASRADRWLALFAAAFAYFGIVFCLGFSLGVARTAILAPMIGAVGAVSLEAPVMLAASWVVCGWIVRLFDVEAAVAPRIAMGVIAFALLMAVEFAVGMLLFARDPMTALQNWATAAGAIGLASQIGFALMPLLRGRLQDR